LFKKETEEKERSKREGCYSLEVSEINPSDSGLYRTESVGSEGNSRGCSTAGEGKKHDARGDLNEKKTERLEGLQSPTGKVAVWGCRVEQK